MLFSFKKIVFALLLLLVSSCLDLVEIKCPDYNCAAKEGLINQGWIPKEIIFESMTNIYQKSDIDINTCIFSYTLGQSDFDSLLLKIKKVDSKKVNTGFFLPHWWMRKVRSLDHYSFFDNSTSDIVFIAIDRSQNRVFGWRDGLF